MPTKIKPPGVKVKLNKNKVIAKAIVLADEGGEGALTMRGIATGLGIKAMSLYHYFSGKEALLDAIVDALFEKIALPDPSLEWKEWMRQRAEKVREVLSDHPWALSLVETRKNPGPHTLAHHDAVLGCLTRAGFSVPLQARAFATIDSYIYGFVLQERNIPFGTGPELEGAVDDLTAHPMAQLYPHLMRFAAACVKKENVHAVIDFPYGLDLILDGLERAHADT